MAKVIVTTAELELIRDLIRSRLGIGVRLKDLDRLQQQVCGQMQALRIETGSEYYQLLKGANSTHDTSWQSLIREVTNTESYFFRDQGQFELLRSQIVPDLIKRRSPERQLTVWSAGCSTGEEVYSLAILLKELILDADRWRIKVWGTDINPNALQAAQKGHYGDWSFRLVDPQIRQRYFQNLTRTHLIDPSIQKFTEFRRFNLLEDKPLPELHNVDLILCRNVFIYFEPQAIAMVLKKFHQVLRPDAYLMTGHAELYGQNLKHFQTQIFAQSLVYKPKVIAPEPLIMPPPLPHFSQPMPPIDVPKPISFRPTEPKLRLSHPVTPSPAPKLPAEETIEPWQKIETLIKNHHYPQAIALLEKQLKVNPRSFQAHYTLGRLHANLGQYSPAIHHCYQALELDQTNLYPYYLLAQIAEDQNHLNEAKRILRQVIYFDMKAVLAYYELAHIYRLEGNGDRAEKMERTALALLDDLPSDLILDPHSQRTAQQLRDEIIQHLTPTT